MSQDSRLACHQGTELDKDVPLLTQSIAPTVAFLRNVSAVSNPIWAVDNHVQTKQPPRTPQETKQKHKEKKIREGVQKEIVTNKHGKSLN